MPVVQRIDLTKAILENIPREEREVLFLLGHAANELNVFQKILLASTLNSSDQHSQTSDLVHASQCFVLMRDLVGKLSESYLLFDKRFKSKRQLYDKYITKISGEGVNAVKKLNVEFGSSGVIAGIRNRFSFHYEDKDGGVESSFQSIPAGEPWIAVLSKMDGNSFYHFSEMAVQVAVLEIVTKRLDSEPFSVWLDRSFSELCNRVINLIRDTQIVFGDIIAAIFTEYVDNIELVSERIPGVAIGDLRLPFFIEKLLA